MCSVRTAAVQGTSSFLNLQAQGFIQWSTLLVGGPGLSQRPIVWHGGEERAPQLAVDEKHNE